MADPAERSALRRYAMDLLARREHSRLELKEKLRRHCGKVAGKAARSRTRQSARRAEAQADMDGAWPEEASAPEPSRSTVDALIEDTLDSLAEAGLQSDARYAEVLIRSRVNRGQGPLRIRADLRQRGLDAAAVEPLLEDYAEQWPDLAQQVVERRFGSDSAADRGEWARRARFLAGRGFPEGLVGRVLGPLP
ncbi:MAG: regulatory protein RecX [Gammaproteobacteria bacterium]|nr:regulatory protein RecX [Gammaproteobacteria bacterium]